MGAFSPDRVKARIAESLAASHPGEDVYVRVENVPYGAWLWDEKELRHGHFPPAELARSLGTRPEMPEVVLSWRELSRE